MFLYKRYNQVELDRQFNNRLHVPNFADYLNRWELLSKQAEQDSAVVKDVSYGVLSREKLDVYPATLPQSKTLVFIHGGYWHMLDKNLFSFIGKSFNAYGITTVLINYPLAPNVTIQEIVLSCRKAINWVYHNITDFNGDPNQLFVAGHSAGGHLASMLLATDWKLVHNHLPGNIIKGACLMSGLFNLAPVHVSYLNAVLRLTEHTLLENSSINYEPLNPSPMLIAVGQDETTEFKEQSRELQLVWSECHKEVTLLELPNANHFSIVDALVDQTSSLHKAMLNLLQVQYQ